MTEFEKQVYDFIRDCVTDRGVSPTFAEIQSGLRQKSTSTVHRAIENLHGSGLIVRRKGISRSIYPSDMAPSLVLIRESVQRALDALAQYDRQNATAKWTLDELRREIVKIGELT